MSTQPPFPQHYQPLAPPKKKRRWLVPAAAAFVALVVGYGMGSTDSSEAEPATTKTETVTETQTVEVAPQSCLDALDAADQVRKDAAKGFDLTIRFTEISQQWPDLVLRAAQAGATLDSAEISAITSEIDGMTTDTNEVNRKLTSLADQTGQDTDNYLAAAEQCRNAS